jgi:hypothetical protein
MYVADSPLRWMRCPIADAVLTLSLLPLPDNTQHTSTAYQAGYSTALQDVLEYLQASLDMDIAQQRSNEGVAQVIDYIEVC